MHLKGLMQFDVNGIIFNFEELKKVSLESLEVNTIQAGHIFYIPGKSSNAFLLLRAGEFLDSSFLDKYAEKGLKEVFILDVCEAVILKKYTELFSHMKNSKDEVSRLLNGQLIVKEFLDDFWHGTKDSYLAFIKACYENFYFLENETTLSIQDKSFALYSRAMITSSLSIINCLMNRIVDPYFLKDIYNAVFVMDYGLVLGEGYNYSISLACESERNNPGSGIGLLKKISKSLDDEKLFLNHPKLSSDFLRDKKNLFFNPELVDIILYHHEKRDGSGFPYGLSYSAITDMETLISFSDHMVSFDEHIFSKGDGDKIVKEAFIQLRQSLKDLPIDHLIKQFESCVVWSANLDKESA